MDFTNLPLEIKRSIALHLSVESRARLMCTSQLNYQMLLEGMAPVIAKRNMLQSINDIKEKKTSQHFYARILLDSMLEGELVRETSARLKLRGKEFVRLFSVFVSSAIQLNGLRKIPPTQQSTLGISNWTKEDVAKLVPPFLYESPVVYPVPL